MKTKMMICAWLLLMAVGLEAQVTLDGRELPTREQVGPSVMPETIAPISAPFEMPQLQRPDIPARQTTVKLRKSSMNTKAIQAAIDEMAHRGGGTVEIPAGEWQTGRIEVKSNVNLHLSEEATLHFSGQIKDYLPVVFTRDEGIEIYSLGAFIYAHNAENIAITGKGRIVGPSIDCEIYQNNKAKALNIEKICLNGEMPLDDRVFDGIKNHGEVFLPKTIAPINCKNVLIEGVTLDQGLYWNVVPQYCENVIIRGVTVNSFGHGRTDGIDVESSKNVLIEYCSLDCQDDCYTMKSGRGVDGLRVNRPTENVVVRHSLALRGAGGIVCGTEVAGFVKNVYCHDCVFDGTDQAFRVKSRRTRGGGIENYFVERVRANVKYQAFYCDLLGEPKWMGELAQRNPKPARTRFTPYFHDISVHDVVIENCRDFISYTGQPELPVKNVFFGNAVLNCQRIGHVQDVTGFALKDVEIHSADSVLTLDGCSVVNIFGVNNIQLKAPVKVIQKGEPSKYVSVQEVPLQPVTYHSIRPGTVWLDTDGKPIQAHGFQITYADGTYYWYGENKADALLGTNQMFGGVRCYSSRDFYNWKDEGLILSPDTVNPLSPIHYSQKLERPHIIRNPRNGKYVLWAKSQAEDGYFAIFEADRFLGPYTFVRNLQPEGYGVGDFDMYVDEQTGKGYVWFERPHWELICAELTDDFLDVTDVYSNHFVGQKPPFTREAPAHFYANGKHYLYTSGTTGYTSNPTEVAVFDDYHGEYRILGDPHVGDSCASSFNSQITGVIKIPGKDMWIALADRWEPHTTNSDFSRKTVEAKKDAYANYKPQPQKPVGTVPQVVDRRYKLVDMAHAVYHAGYVFLPITFEDGIPKIHWQDEWQIADDELYSEFSAVPDSARTKVWWFHGENITTREGITADLEAYKEAGIGGVVYYDQQHGPGTPDAQKAMSPEWWAMLKFAGQEAMRLGLSFDINISNGYVCGGPWITPELSMQIVRSSEVIIKGGERFHDKLPATGKRELEDIAVLAFPIASDSQKTVTCLPEGFTAREATMVPLASFEKPFTARSLSYNMEGFSKAPQSIVNIPCDPQEKFCGDRFTWQPPIGELEVSDDSIHWRKAAVIHSIYRAQSQRPNYTISFPAATGRFFRLNLHDWTPAAGWFQTSNDWAYVEEKTERPLKLKNVELSSIAKMDRWEERAAYFTDYIRPSETPAFDGGEIIDPTKMLNLSQYVNAEGLLDWTAPQGSDWKMIRFVNCATGGFSKHGRPNLLGPECDKLSAKGAEVHWQHYTKPILDTLRVAGVKVGSVCIDSHEAGSQNWTHDFAELFQKERGYDILPWLPAMQGYIVESVDKTERFLQDLRRTIADGICSRYFATIQKLCRQEGVELTAQAMGNGQSICSDNLMAKGIVDRPQGEFWTRQHHGSYDTREAASAAHLYGKTIASAEAFTDFDYTKTLDIVKDEIDMETAMQVNEFVICASEFQPWTDPTRINTGYNRDYAFNRANPLMPFARGFFDYQARHHFMMRQGVPVVDVLVYAGDQAPMKLLAHRLPIIPEGYDFDVCTTDALLHAVCLQDGRLQSKGGCQYQLLAIEKSAVLRPETERLIAEWKSQGLPVFDNRTQPDNGMSAVLASAGIRPDVAIQSRVTALDRVFTSHRQTYNADIYFFVNHSEDRTFSDTITLRTKYRTAEWWNAMDGSRRSIPGWCSNDDGLCLQLHLQPGEAGFIVASSDSKAKEPYHHQAVAEDTHPVSGSWTLSFDTTLGGPDKPVVTKELFDLTTSDIPSVRYFSGLVTYINSFQLKQKPEGRLLLRIPGLKGAARIFVNEKEAGLVWCSPWEADITSLVKKGKNALRIEVRTTLANALIGNAALQESDRKIWTYTQLYKPTDKLQPSGIVGDVLLVSQE